jgi:hypothetical protein
MEKAVINAVSRRTVDTAKEKLMKYEFMMRMNPARKASPLRLRDHCWMDLAMRINGSIDSMMIRRGRTSRKSIVRMEKHAAMKNVVRGSSPCMKVCFCLNRNASKIAAMRRFTSASGVFD